MTSSPPRHDRRALPTRPVRHVAFDVARAFLVTPPPEDDDSSVHCDAYCTVLGKSMLKVKDEQYETLQRIESLETRSLQASEQAWRKPSSSPSVRENSFYEFVDERIQGLPIDEIVDQGRTVVAKVEEMVEEMERRFESVYEKLEGLDTQMEEFDQDMDKRFTAVDNRLNALSTEFDEADVRLGAQIDETSKSLSQDLQDFELRMDVRFEAIRAMQWNALVSRPVDIVQPVPFVHRNEDGEWTKSQTPRRKLKWWWKLHEFRKRPQLVELLRHTGIGWRSWLEEVNTSSDSDSECSSSDEENLDNQYGPVSTLDDAVRRNQKAAVRALFAHMGLGYQRFEELFARDAQRLRGEQQPAKRSLDSPTSHEHANRRRTSQGELRGPSYWGSPTEVISRRSGPAGPNISATSSTES